MRACVQQWILQFAAAMCWTTPAFGAAVSDYPMRPVRLLLPFAPGGSVDGLARIISRRSASDGPAMGDATWRRRRTFFRTSRAAPDGYLCPGLSTIVTAIRLLTNSLQPGKDLQPGDAVLRPRHTSSCAPSVPAPA